MKKWTRPECYFGASWPNWYVFMTTSRDADALTESNYRTALKLLRAVPTPAGWAHDEAPVQTVRENHWLVGWVEWIGIHEDATEAFELALALEIKMDLYPVLDDEDLTECEIERGEYDQD